jgi:hypothetical protein
VLDGRHRRVLHPSIQGFRRRVLFWGLGTRYLDPERQVGVEGEVGVVQVSH